MRPQDFYMVSRASKGVLVNLVDPSGNKEWMRVRSVVSEEFKSATKRVILAAAREGKSLAGDRDAIKRQVRTRRAELAESLIAEWSLPMSETAERVSLLIKNPRLRRSIEKIAENHSQHFGVHS